MHMCITRLMVTGSCDVTSFVLGSTEPPTLVFCGGLYLLPPKASGLHLCSQKDSQSAFSLCSNGIIYFTHGQTIPYWVWYLVKEACIQSIGGAVQRLASQWQCLGAQSPHSNDSCPQCFATLFQELMSNASRRDVDARCGLYSRNVVIRTQTCQLNEYFGSWVHSCYDKHISILLIKALDIRLPPTAAYRWCF